MRETVARSPQHKPSAITLVQILLLKQWQDNMAPPALSKCCVLLWLTYKARTTDLEIAIIGQQRCY
jgi:hypothetical protein